MVSWWGIDSSFNNERIQISDVQLKNIAYGSLGYFGSRVRSKSIGRTIYTGRRSNFHLKTTPIHIPVHKYYCNYSYLRSHFSQLPKVVSKEIINRLFHKVSYASMKIDPVINIFSPNEVKLCPCICDHSMVTFGIP